MSQKIKITVMGDICPTEDYRKLFDSGDPRLLFGNSLEVIRNSDIAIANLECPATDGCNRIVKCGPNLKAKPEDIRLLKDAGIHVLSLANNHILDYGGKAVEETISVCKSENILTFGAGKNSAEAEKPMFIDIKQKRICLMSFAEEEFNLASEDSPGANRFDAYESFDRIKNAKEDADYLIILYHGGVERYAYPSPLLQKKCRKMASSGADLILCQHSHCIGTLERYNNAHILYGQGNSVYGYRKNEPSWNEGLIAEITIDGGVVSLSWRLLNAEPDGITLCAEEQTSEKTKLIFENSKRITDKNFIQTEWEAFCEKNKSLYFPLLYGMGRIFNKLNRILNNAVIRLLYSKKRRMVTMNLIRCDAHREVVQTLLEKENDE